jgi:hypothetical protein
MSLAFQDNAMNLLNFNEIDEKRTLKATKHDKYENIAGSV